MPRLNDAVDNPDSAGGREFDWKPLISFLRELIAHYWLLFVIMVVMVVGVLGKYTTLQPQFTAVAVIGPPGPSTVGFLANGDAGNAASSAARRILGDTGSSSSSDPYQEYLQLLHSVRLAKVLIEKDHLLQVLYAGSWDPESHSWRPPGALHTAVANIKQFFFHRPTKDVPDVDTMVGFLGSNLIVARVGADSGVARLLSNSSPYSTVSFGYSDPKGAEDILNMILQEADGIIRQERRRDVNARLAFLNAEMPKVTVSDQREALIAIMSGQEQLSMMIEADKRYASTLVDPPHASSLPTSPKGPSFFLMAAMAFSIVIWVGLIYLATRFDIVRTGVRRVERVISLGRAS